MILFFFYSRARDLYLHCVCQAAQHYQIYYLDNAQLATIIIYYKDHMCHVRLKRVNIFQLNRMIPVLHWQMIVEGTCDLFSVIGIVKIHIEYPITDFTLLNWKKKIMSFNVQYDVVIITCPYIFFGRMNNFSD